MNQRKPTQHFGAEVTAQTAKKGSANAGEDCRADSAPLLLMLGGKSGFHGSGTLPCGLGGGFENRLGLLRSDVGPLDVGPQIVASNGAACALLDLNTYLRRNLAFAVAPKADCLRCNAQVSRQIGGASHMGNGGFDR